MSIFYFGGFNKKPTSLETRAYMNGECAYFALALHKQNPSSTLIEADRSKMIKDTTGTFVGVLRCLTSLMDWVKILLLKKLMSLMLSNR